MFKSLGKKFVMVDPSLCGIYIEREVATLDTVNLSSVNSGGSDPLLGKFSLLDSPFIRSQNEDPQTGMGESQPGEPEGCWISPAVVSGIPTGGAGLSSS